MPSYERGVYAPDLSDEEEFELFAQWDHNKIEMNKRFYELKEELLRVVPTLAKAKTRLMLEHEERKKLIKQHMYDEMVGGEFNVMIEQQTVYAIERALVEVDCKLQLEGRRRSQVYRDLVTVMVAHTMAIEQVKKTLGPERMKKDTKSWCRSQFMGMLHPCRAEKAPRRV